MRKLGIRSIALPPPGCGNGGLRWSAVEPLIRRKLESVPDVDVLLYAPEGAPAAANMPNDEPKPAMTAALIAVMAQYARHAMGEPSLIETQKLAYFLQAAGEPLRLNFVGRHYGPNADNLRHVRKLLEVERVMRLVEGFESAYALELLATVHWVLDHAAEGREPDDVVAAVRSWSQGRMFTPEHIKVAIQALQDRGWVTQLAESS